MTIAIKSSSLRAKPMFTWKFVLLFLILFGSYTTQAVTGFGAVVISVTLGALIYPIDTLVAVVVPLNVVLTTYLVIRHHKHIDWKLFLKKIMPLMAVGMGMGIVTAAYLKGARLVAILGVLVVLVSARELLVMFKNTEPGHNSGPLHTMLWIFAAGLVHGIYASGGPFLVYAIGKMNIGKAAFRGTLSVVWLSLNSVLTMLFLLNGRLNLETGKIVLWLLPAIPIGIWLGEIVHERVSERHFRFVTFGLLIVAGGALILKALGLRV